VAIAVSKLIRLASVVICLIAAVSFLLFAIDQTSTASGHQQEEVTGQPVNPTTTSGSAAGGQTAGTSASKENDVRKVLDEATEDFAAPVSGLTSSSEWGSRGLRLIFVLLVYGFGLGYLARVLRVRV
jgi:hypothetical protein